MSERHVTSAPVGKHDATVATISPAEAYAPPARDPTDTASFRWLRHILLLVVLPAALGVATTVALLIHAFRLVATTAPENKSAFLAHQISTAMGGTKVGFVVALVGVVVTIVRARRWRAIRKRDR